MEVVLHCHSMRTNLNYTNVLLGEVLPNLIIINAEKQILWTSEAFSNHFTNSKINDFVYLADAFSPQNHQILDNLIQIATIKGRGIAIGIPLFEDTTMRYDVSLQIVQIREETLYRIEWNDAQASYSADKLSLQLENESLRLVNKEYNTIHQHLHAQLEKQQRLIERLSAENNYLFETHEDVSEQNLAVVSAEKLVAQSQLIQSQKRLQLALDAGQLGIWDWDIETDYVVYNKRWGGMLGYEEEDIQPNVKTFFSLLHPDDAVVMQELVKKHINGETPFFEVELRLKGKDGTYHWIYDRGMVVARDAEGKGLRAVGVHVYINDNKKAAYALKQSEQKFKNIFHFNSIGIIVADMNGNIIDANPQTVHILGYELAELQQLRPIDFSHPDDLAKERKEAKEMLVSGRDFFQMEKRYIRKDGTVIWTNFSLTIIRDEDKQLQMAIALIEDITEKKQADEQLKSQNEMLLKVNEELNHFVYRTSHDLRSPITSLMGLVQIIEISKIEAERNKYLSLMTNQLNYLDSVIKEIIDYRKVSAGEISCSPVNLGMKVMDVLECFQFLPNYDQIEKHITIDEEIPFYSDETKIAIILNNLLSNSIKYFDKKKEEPYLDIKVNVTEQAASIVIQDNGIGIPEAHLPSIFKMFFRATTQQNGTGLGLYIVAEALAKLGGTISVESEVNVGTCFTLSIPNKSI